MRCARVCVCVCMCVCVCVRGVGQSCHAPATSAIANQKHDSKYIPMNEIATSCNILKFVMFAGGILSMRRFINLNEIGSFSPFSSTATLPDLTSALVLLSSSSEATFPALPS